MGRDLYEKTEFGKRIFRQADEILGYHFSRICFEGPEEELKLTHNTQPALLTVSYILYHLLDQTPALGAGHSLGEYSALLCAGTLKFEDAVLLVHKRGRYMQEAVPVGEGRMAALIGPEIGPVSDVLEKIDGVVDVANHNSRNQIVISGEAAAVERAVKLIDAKRSVFLNVSAPFHSRLMMPAQEKLAVDLDNTEFQDPVFPVISNVTAREMTDGKRARQSLKDQVSRPVRWYQTMSLFLEERRVEKFAEIGSGRVLSGLIKRTARELDRRIEVVNIANLEELNQL